MNADLDIEMEILRYVRGNTDKRKYSHATWRIVESLAPRTQFSAAEIRTAIKRMRVSGSLQRLASGQAISAQGRKALDDYEFHSARIAEAAARKAQRNENFG